MAMSKRAQRMERHHGRRAKTTLNLVSLMDIFTILVFFLLVNSSEVETLEASKAVQMPESIAEQKPSETVVVMVTRDDILVQGVAVATTAEVMASDRTVIEALKTALQGQVERLVTRQGADDPSSREVTIMGDKAIPYRLLKKVMATCTDADYGSISLAVVQKGVDKDTRS